MGWGVQDVRGHQLSSLLSTCNTFSRGSPLWVLQAVFMIGALAQLDLSHGTTLAQGWGQQWRPLQPAPVQWQHHCSSSSCGGLKPPSSVWPHGTGTCAPVPGWQPAPRRARTGHRAVCCPWSDVQLNPSRAAAAEQMEGDQPPGDPQGRLHREWPRAQELLIQRGERIEPSPSFLPPAASPDWHGMSPRAWLGSLPAPCQPPEGAAAL